MSDYRIEEALEKFILNNSDDGRKQDGFVVLPRLFEVVGGEIVHKDTGLPIDNPEVRAAIEKARPHLFPPKVEVSLAHRAFVDGNLSARGALVKEIGELEATRVAKSYGLKGLGDTRKGTAPEGAREKLDDKPNNPWSAAGWSITRQGQVIKAMGIEKASAIARAAGSRIGATKPAVAA